MSLDSESESSVLNDNFHSDVSDTSVDLLSRDTDNHDGKSYTLNLVRWYRKYDNQIFKADRLSRQVICNQACLCQCLTMIIRFEYQRYFSIIMDFLNDIICFLISDAKSLHDDDHFMIRNSRNKELISEKDLHII